MISYHDILIHNYTNKQWIMVGQDYEGLEWHDESPKPTKEELDNLWETTLIKIEENKKSIEDTRQSALNKLMALGLTEEEALALGNNLK